MLVRDLEPSIHPDLMNEEDKLAFCRHRLIREEMRHKGPRCPAEVQALLDAVHGQANPAHRAEQAMEEFEQIREARSQVASAAAQARREALDELDQIAWSETDAGLEHDKAILESEELDFEDQGQLHTELESP